MAALFFYFAKFTKHIMRGIVAQLGEHWSIYRIMGRWFEFILVIKVDYLSRHGVRKKVLLPVHSMAGLNRFLIRDMMFLLLQDTALLISGEYSKGKRDDSL